MGVIIPIPALSYVSGHPLAASAGKFNCSVEDQRFYNDSSMRCCDEMISDQLPLIFGADLFPLTELPSRSSHGRYACAMCSCAAYFKAADMRMDALRLRGDPDGYEDKRR